MTSETNLRINAPFIEYVAENKGVTKPFEKKPKRSIFERIDDGIGLNWLKTNIKKYTGITYLSDKITDVIDDGDDNHLSLGERLWEGVKGAGKAVEDFIGSQGLAFMGAMMLGSYVAGLAGIGKIFNLVTKGYFLFQGTKLAVQGTKEFVQADTKDGAKNGATTATTGGIMLFGTIKGLIKDIKGMRTEYQAKQTAKVEFNSQVESSRAKLEIPEGEVLSEVTLKKAYRKAALKNHPDRGGSEAAMADVTAAYEFLLKNLKSAQKVRTTAAPVTDVPVTDVPVTETVNMSGEQGLVLASHYNNAAATNPVIIPLNPNPVSSTPVQTGRAKTVSITTGTEIPTTVEGMRAAIEHAMDLDVLRSYRPGMKKMPSDIKALYVQKEQDLRKGLTPVEKSIRASLASFLLDLDILFDRVTGYHVYGASRASWKTSWEKREEAKRREEERKARESKEFEERLLRIVSGDSEPEKSSSPGRSSRPGVNEVVAQINLDGEIRLLNDSGKHIEIKYKDGSYEHYTYYEENEKLKEAKLKDGTRQLYDIDGHLTEEILKDGTRKLYDTDGKLTEEIEPNGTHKWYDESGKLKVKETIQRDGSRKKIDVESGRLIEQTTKNGTVRRYLDGGVCETYKPVNGELKLFVRTYPDWTMDVYTYNKNGELDIISMHDGTSINVPQMKATAESEYAAAKERAEARYQEQKAEEIRQGEEELKALSLEIAGKELSSVDAIKKIAFKKYDQKRSSLFSEYDQKRSSIFSEFDQKRSSLFSEYDQKRSSLYKKLIKIKEKAYKDYKEGRITQQEKMDIEQQAQKEWWKACCEAEEEWWKAHCEAEKEWSKAHSEAEKEWLKADSEAKEEYHKIMRRIDSIIEKLKGKNAKRERNMAIKSAEAEYDAKKAEIEKYMVKLE